MILSKIKRLFRIYVRIKLVRWKRLMTRGFSWKLRWSLGAGGRGRGRERWFLF